MARENAAAVEVPMCDCCFESIMDELWTTQASLKGMQAGGGHRTAQKTVLNIVNIRMT